MSCTKRSRFIRVLVAAGLILAAVPAPAMAETSALVYSDTLPTSHEHALASATGVCLQPGTEKVFVVDRTARSVHRYSADGSVHEAAWSDASGEAFVEPTDVAADTSGNIYVADAGRGYVYKLDASTGALITKLGSGLVDAVGIDWFSSGGQAFIYVADRARGKVLRFGTTSDTSTGFEFDAGGTLVAPEDVAVTLTGDGLMLWTVDSAAHKVKCLTWSDVVQTSWGTTGTAAGQLQGPTGIDVRGDGSVLVVDADRVQRFSQGGVYLDSLAAQGAGVGQVQTPQRVTVDPGNDNAWIADSGNARAQKLSSGGAFVAQFGSGPGSGAGQFNAPRHLAVAPDGALWVADSLNHRIQRIDASGTATAYGSEGSGSGEFRSPWGIAVDGAGNVYVADTLNDRIQKLDASGTVLAVWGTSGTGPGQFDEPKAVAVDAQGCVYVADTGNWRVQKLDPSGSFVSAWTSYGTPLRYLYRPADIAVGPDGHVFVYDGFNMRVVEFRGDGSVARVWGDRWSPGYEFVGYWSGLDVSDTGNLYVADWMTLRVHGADDGAGMVFQSVASGTGPGEGKNPTDIAVGPFGTVWVSDATLHRVQRYELPDTAPPFTNRMGGTGEWTSGSGEHVYVMRPTDWPAGPLETWVSVDGGPAERVWHASQEDTVNTNVAFYLSDEGENRLDYWSVDAYGNREETKTAWVRIDRTAPEATWTVQPSTWTTAASVVASLAASDGLSGVNTKKCYLSGATPNPTGASQFDYTVPITITNEGTTNLYAEVRDQAGLATARGAVARIDRTPPSTQAWVFDLGSPGARTLWLYGTDALSGVTNTYYRVDDAAVPSIGTQVSLSIPGTRTVEFWSVDSAGNVESAQSTEVVVPDDTTPPEATGFEIENNGGWTNKTEARAYLEASEATKVRFSPDGVSWSMWQPYSTEVTVTLPASEGSFDMRAQFADDALNVSDELSFGIAIDRTPPVTQSNKADVISVSPPAEITFAPGDGTGSGPAGTYYQLDNGPVTAGFSCTTSVPGSHTVEFWSVDIAGNEEEHQSHAFFVADPPAPTSTGLNVSTTLVNYGGQVTVYGQPRDANGTIIPEGEVTLWTRAYGSSAWYQRATAGWDPGSQCYIASAALTIGSHVQMRYSGDPGHAPSESSAVFVRASAKVGNPVAPSAVYRNRRFTTYGYLYPSHAAGTPVRVYKYRYVSGKWRPYGYVTAKTVAGAKYSISMTLPYSGRWRLRAYHADGGHQAAYSAGFDYVTVR